MKLKKELRAVKEINEQVSPHSFFFLNLISFQLTRVLTHQIDLCRQARREREEQESLRSGDHHHHHDKSNKHGHHQPSHSSLNDPSKLQQQPQQQQQQANHQHDILQVAASSNAAVAGLAAMAGPDGVLGKLTAKSLT